jgi:hypothetical protein
VRISETSENLNETTQRHISDGSLLQIGGNFKVQTVTTLAFYLLTLLEAFTLAAGWMTGIQSPERAGIFISLSLGPYFLWVAPSLPLNN